MPPPPEPARRDSDDSELVRGRNTATYPDYTTNDNEDLELNDCVRRQERTDTKCNRERELHALLLHPGSRKAWSD